MQAVRDVEAQAVDEDGDEAWLLEAGGPGCIGVSVRHRSDRRLKRLGSGVEPRPVHRRAAADTAV